MSSHVPPLMGHELEVIFWAVLALLILSNTSFLMLGMCVIQVMDEAWMGFI